MLDRIDAFFVDEDSGKWEVESPTLSKQEVASAEAMLKSPDVELEKDVRKRLKEWIGSAATVP